MKKLIDKNFLLNVLDKNDSDALKHLRPKPNYKIIDKLEITLNVKTSYYIVGIKVPPNLINNSLKTGLPVTLFGLMDYFSGYLASLKYVLKNNPAWHFDVGGITGFNPIYYIGNTELGDYQTAFHDAVNMFNTESFVNISTSNQTGYGSIMNNLNYNSYLIDTLRIEVDKNKINQFDNPLILTKLRIDGKITSDQLSVNTFIKPSNFQTSIVEIPLNIILDKNLMINQNINYDCEYINYTFKLKKIK